LQTTSIFHRRSPCWTVGESTNWIGSSMVFSYA
jgi:hypothetical protein